MIEGELFGYMKGAFTGATNDFRGMIAEAEGSTLFLDEISEMPAELQTRFLRVLQEREFRPLGSTKTLKADFRVVAATNRPVAAGARREPPPLRSLLSAEYFPDRIAAAARAERGYPAAGRHVCEKFRAAAWESGTGDFAGSVPETARLRLAGKCARAAKRDGIRRRPRAPGPDHGEGIAG